MAESIAPANEQALQKKWSDATMAAGNKIYQILSPFLELHEACYAMLEAAREFKKLKEQPQKPEEPAQPQQPAQGA